MFRTAYREIGLFGLVKRTVNEFLEDDMPTYASALAYQMLFSLFPFLLVLITLVGYLHLPEFFAWLREQAALLLPPEAMDQVNPVIDQLQQQKGGLLSIGIAVALWTSSAGIRSMMIALNAAYDVKESRPVWKRFSLSILYTLGIALLLLVAAGLMVTGPQVIAWIAGLVGLEQYLVTLWTWLRWP
ncbi:YihY/virulence factor BrkB family protein, partial [Pseudomonas aeruginosa]